MFSHGSESNLVSSMVDHFCAVRLGETQIEFFPAGEVNSRPGWCSLRRELLWCFSMVGTPRTMGDHGGFTEGTSLKSVTRSAKRMQRAGNLCG